MKTLTPKQQKIYDYILDFTAEHGYPPSVPGRASVGKDLVRSFYVACRCLYREPGGIRLSWAEFIFFAAKIRFVE